ncbi:MAG: polysaccharide pyruvyl transferase CsaB [Oscillospiraceae bacterium]|nr:polysaccharide pyruvyl transferase CsaB [Oscillospiraceae bacterium]
MNVVHLTSGGDVGGAKTHVLGLLQKLSERHTVHLVCFTHGEFAQEAESLGIPTTVFTGNFFSVVKQTATLVKQQNCQIIHCHGARANLVGSFLRKKTGLPVVTTVHSDYKLDYMGRPMARLFYGTANAYALRHLDYYVGISDPMADMLIARKFDPQRMFSIYNGVEFPPPPVEKSRKEFLSQWGVGEDKVVFGIAARLSPVKNIELLLSAFSKAVAEEKNLHLLIAGDGELREKLQAMAQSLCPQGSVTFCGWLSNMADFYNAIDVNLLTSHSEAFPYALPEGARYHCATISSRVGGVPRYIDHGKDGLLFPVGDEKALLKYLLRMAREPELRAKFAQNLYHKTKTSFSVDAMCHHQEEIYETILRKEARKGQKRDGVMVCGAYGRDNAGDDAILQAIVRQMRSIDKDIPIYVLTRKPLQTALRHRVGTVYTFNYFAYRKALRHTALYLNGGGSLIQDVTSSRSLWYYLLSIATARKMGNQVLMYGCGIGPVNKGFNRRLAGKIIDKYAHAITLREDLSLKTLQDMGVKTPRMTLTADPAILLSPASEEKTLQFLQEQGIGEDYFLVCLRNWKGIGKQKELIASAVKKLAEKYTLRPVFLAMEAERDLPVCRNVAEMVGGSVPVLSAPADTDLLLGLIQQAKAVISMRLHALIFAASVGTPLVGLSYDPKVMGFVRYLGQDLCLELSELSEEAILTASEKALSGDYDYSKRAQELRALAEDNCHIAQELLEK